LERLLSRRPRLKKKKKRKKKKKKIRGVYIITY
jgi:hypothetical protein